MAVVVVSPTEPTVLGAEELADLANLHIRRWKKRENPLKNYKGADYLWSDPSLKDYILHDAALRGTFFGDSLRWSTANNGKKYVRFTDRQARQFMSTWNAMPPVVVIDDLARFTMAIDFNFTEPRGKRTEIGELVYEAKYKDSQKALDELCERAAASAADIRVFSGVAHVVPVPPSQVRNSNKVPSEVAKAIAEALGAEYSPGIAQAVASRRSLKSVAKAEKAELLQGTIAVSPPDLFEATLLVDDHYQSGTTLNYVVRALQREEEFLTVYGFACDKTLSNKDNIRTDVEEDDV